MQIEVTERSGRYHIKAEFTTVTWIVTTPFEKDLLIALDAIGTTAILRGRPCTIHLYPGTPDIKNALEHIFYQSAGLVHIVVFSEHGNDQA